MNWETIFVGTWLIWSLAIAWEIRMAREAVQEIAQNFNHRSTTQEE